MKRMVFVCHARAKKDESIADRERTLTKKGIESARAVVQTLADEGFAFDLVATSPASRAVNTALLFSNGASCGMEVLTGLYQSADVQWFGEWLGGISESVSTVVIVGHAPGLTLLVQSFDGSFSEHIPPAGAVVVESSAERWIDAVQTGGKVERFLIPFDSADFVRQIRRRERDVSERLSDVMLTELRRAGADRMLEKSAREYARQLAQKAVKGMTVVAVEGGAGEK